MAAGPAAGDTDRANDDGLAAGATAELCGEDMTQDVREEEVRAGLRAFIEEEVLLGADESSFADDDPLLSGGVIGSFHLVQLAVFAEDTFGVRIPDDHLTPDRLDTLAAMTDYVLARLP